MGGEARRGEARRGEARRGEGEGRDGAEGGKGGRVRRWRGREAYGEGAVGNRLTVNGNVEPMRAFASVRGMRMLKTCHYALHCVVHALWHAEQYDMSYRMLSGVRPCHAACCAIGRTVGALHAERAPSLRTSE